MGLMLGLLDDGLITRKIIARVGELVLGKFDGLLLTLLDVLLVGAVILDKGQAVASKVIGPLLDTDVGKIVVVGSEVGWSLQIVGEERPT